MAKVDVGTGTTLQLAALGFTFEVLGIAASGIAAEIVDITHMATPVPSKPPTPGANSFGSRRFMPGDHVDPGTLKVDIHADPSQVPPVGVKDTMTLSWPIPAGKTTPTTWVGSVIVQDFEEGAQLEGKMVGSLTLKLDGAQVVTPEA